MAKSYRPMSSPRPDDVDTLSSEALRQAFLVENVMQRDKIAMTFTDLDRLALGGASPVDRAMQLDNDPETGADFFLARRELGIINVGHAGKVHVDGKTFDLANLDGLYVSMGSKNVGFESADTSKPAKYFLMSCPAHQAFVTTHIPKVKANPVRLGAQATANKRTIYQYIHPGGVKSAQLVMGFTILDEGSVWNTMPPHTHSRRTEIYFYFDIAENQVVAHFLGQPDRTRHLFVHNEQTVLSPPWSIHCGCGTSAYKFIWAMAGENQVFDDMDKVGPLELR